MSTTDIRTEGTPPGPPAKTKDRTHYLYQIGRASCREKVSSYV